MAETKAFLKMMKESLEAKGHKVSDALIDSAQGTMIERKFAAAQSGTAAKFEGIEAKQLKAVTSQILDGLKKTPDGKFAPGALLDLQHAYASSVIRKLGAGDEAAAQVAQFKASVKEVLADGYGKTPARVEAIADKKAARTEARAAAAPKPTPVSVAQSKPEVAAEVLDAAPAAAKPKAAPTPEPEIIDVEAKEVKPASKADGPAAAAAPDKEPAAPAAAKSPAEDPNSIDAQTRARVLAEEDRRKQVAEVELQREREKNLVDIRGGMGKARGDAAQGLLDFRSATDSKGKQAAFNRINGADENGKQTLDGFRRTGWIPDKNDPNEMFKVTQHYMSTFTDAEGNKLFDNPAHKKHIETYVIAQETKATGARPTDAKIEELVNQHIDGFKKEFARNERAGLIGKLDTDGFRSRADIEKMIENRTMTPLAFDKSVVDNPPGAWIKSEEWDKVRRGLMGELKATQQRDLVNNLRDLSKLEDNVALDTDAIHKTLEDMRIVSRSPELRAIANLSDELKFDAAKKAAAEKGAEFTEQAPKAKTPQEIRQSLYDGTIHSENELHQLEVFYRANKLQTEAKGEISALRDLLKHENTVDFKADDVRTRLDAMRAIERRPDYQALTERSPAGKAHDDAVKAAADGQVPPPRKIEDIKQDVFNNNRFTRDELYQLEQHYNAMGQATKARVEINAVREILRKEGTTDLALDANHPGAAKLPEGKGLHERLEAIRELERNPNYQAHYPLSASAQAAEKSGVKRQPEEIVKDLYSNTRVSRDELYQLEAHYRAGMLRADISEAAEKAVKFPHDPTDRAKALKEFAGGELNANMQALRRRIQEQELAAGNVPAAHQAAQSVAPVRTIHEIVQDVADGKISIAEGRPMSMQDGKVFADKYKAYVSGEGQALEARQITDRLAALYEPSNGPFRTVRKEDKAVLKQDFTRLREIMENPEYKVFTANLGEEGAKTSKDVRKNIDKIMDDLKEGNPVNPKEVRRMQQFFERWHNEDQKPPVFGRLTSALGARYWDRRFDAMGTGVVATAAVGTVGALTLAGGGIASLTSSFNSNGGPVGNGQSQSGPTINNAPFGGKAPAGYGPPQTGVSASIGRIVEGVAGKVGAGTAENVAAGELIKRGDQGDYDQYIGEVVSVGEKLQKRVPELTNDDLNSIANVVAGRYRDKFREDQKLELGEAIDAYRESIPAAPATAQPKLKTALDMYETDVDKAEARHRVLLQAGTPTPGQ